MDTIEKGRPFKFQIDVEFAHVIGQASRVFTHFPSCLRLNLAALRTLMVP